MQRTPRETRLVQFSRKGTGTWHHCGRQPKYLNLLQSRKGHKRTTLNTRYGRKLVIRSLKAGAERLTSGASQIISLNVTQQLTLQVTFDSGGRLFTRVQTAPTTSFHFRGPNSWGKSVSTNSLLSGNPKDGKVLLDPFGSLLLLRHWHVLQSMGVVERAYKTHYSPFVSFI
jgi:hypothetical protein